MRKYKSKIDPEELYRLLEEDPFWGRNQRIAKKLNVCVSTVYVAIKKLDRLPPFETQTNAETLANYRARIKQETGLSPKALGHVRDPRQMLVKQARTRAKYYGREFDLYPSDIHIPETCPVLGIPIIVNTGNKGIKDQSPSLDRVNNAGGYTWDNVIVISYRANVLKNSASKEELTKIANFFNSYVSPTERKEIEPSRRKAMRKLTEAQELELRQDHIAGATMSSLVHKYGISLATVRTICRGRPPRDTSRPHIKKMPKK